MAGWTHHTRSVISRLIYISECLSYVAMARSDEEGCTELVSNIALNSCNGIELCLTQSIPHLSYYMSESVKGVSCLQVLGPHPLGPRQN